MSTHNICFYGEIKKFQYFWIEKSILSRAIVIMGKFTRILIPVTVLGSRSVCMLA